MTAEPRFQFFTDSVSYKSVAAEDGSEEHYVEGYISTSDLDRVGEVVSRKALEGMIVQIKNKNIKLDVEHEAWLKSPNVLPIGRILDAHLDEKGIYIKAVLNKHNSRFDEVWGSIKAGFVDAFSIAYKTLKFATKQVGGKTVKILDELELLNVALTGNPANPECRIAAVMTKSFNQVNEVDHMADEEQTVDQPVTPPVPSEPAQAAPAEPAPEVVDVKSILSTVDALKAEITELKNIRAEDSTALKAMQDKLKAAEEALSKPQMKHLAQEAPKAEPEVAKTPLQMIR
jgi:HK97 family phage prohead protease